jgi:hypothetical protein
MARAQGMAAHLLLLGLETCKSVLSDIKCIVTQQCRHNSTPLRVGIVSSFSPHEMSHTDLQQWLLSVMMFLLLWYHMNTYTINKRVLTSQKESELQTIICVQCETDVIQVL